MFSSKKIYFLIILAIFIAFGMIFFLKCRSEEENYQVITEYTHEKQQEYVGSTACQSCHAQIYDEWKQSDHFKAMQMADSTSVLGDFNDKILVEDGISSRFFKKEGKYYIYTEDENGKYRDFQVLYTFGYYPLQQYLAEFDGGRLQVFRQSWDSREKKWFHQYKNQKIPHKDWLHWTGNAQNWNLMCASCHSTNLQKNYDPQTDTYQTTFSEITVGCESCHGAGKTHISFIKSSDYQKDKSENLFIHAGKNRSQNASLNTCFPCHSRRGEVGGNHIVSEEILDNFIPEIPAKNFYFADGQALDEVYKYASFLQSKMYQNGVKCTDCHLPHSGKLKAAGDKVCMQCHTENYASENHTFHKENTEASDCRSCHMPTRTYMGNDNRHDHNFAVPRPDLSEKYGVPNACNQCHHDKSASWVSNFVKKWYGTQRKPHFAEKLIQGSAQNGQSLPYLQQLLSENDTPTIIKATAIHYLSGIQNEKSQQLIEKELQNPDAQTRYRAVLALLNFPIENYQQKIIPLLQDKVRAVRIATANLVLTQLGLKQAQLISHFESAQKELEQFLLNQSDFAIGSASLADYFVKIEQPENAILFYERALKKDRTLTYVRLNLATLYNQQQQNEKALSVLLEGLLLEEKNAQLHYYIALLYSELSELSKAKEHFEKAMKLGLNTERVKRNYKLLLEQMN